MEKGKQKIEKWKMMTGEWTMGKGNVKKWKIDNGQWKMEN